MENREVLELGNDNLYLQVRKKTRPLKCCGGCEHSDQCNDVQTLLGFALDSTTLQVKDSVASRVWKTESKQS